MMMTLFGGVFLLMYGVKLAGEGLKGWAGARIKTAIETMTRNRFAALFTGVAVTFLLQSSSATTVTLVSLIDSGLISFPQSLGVILGADIGTTITVQLISFRIYDFGVFFCGVGLAVMYVVKDAGRKSAGQAVLGFGLIFLAIKLMADSMEPYKDNELLRDLLAVSANSPFLGVLISALATALIHSSAAVIGIILTFTLNGIMGLDAAIPLVLGANIGTGATAMVSAMKSTTEAKRAAFANVMFKAIGVLLCLPLLHPFARLVEMTTDSIPRQVANAHTIFNVAAALIFLPFTGFFARKIEEWFPVVERPEEEFKPKYLNPSMLATPSLALGQATRETLREAEIIQDMYRLSLPSMMQCDLDLVERVETMDDRVDLLDRSIRFYLTHLSKSGLSPEEANRQMEILACTSNLESIGDILDKNLMELARKKARKCVQFSPKGQAEIADLHARILENLETAMNAFTTRDRDMAERVFQNKARIKDLEKEYNRRHIERLESGLSESFETSSIHLDVLTNLKRINTHTANIAYAILSSTQPPA